MSAAAGGLRDLAGRTPLAPARLTLREAVARIAARTPALRQERLSGIHNPWGHGIGFTDPWSFLDVCESDPVIEAARPLIGPDIILWDSELFVKAGDYGGFVAAGREGRYWPVTPREGALVLTTPGRETPSVTAVRLGGIGPEALEGIDAGEPLYVIRLMPATSLFDRDPRHPANRALMEEQVLLNYSNRPLWLLSGIDRAGNDLVSGFAPAVPVWASAAGPGKTEET